MGASQARHHCRQNATNIATISIIFISITTITIAHQLVGCQKAQWVRLVARPRFLCFTFLWAGLEDMHSCFDDEIVSLIEGRLQENDVLSDCLHLVHFSSYVSNGRLLGAVHK